MPTCNNSGGHAALQVDPNQVVPMKRSKYLVLYFILITALSADLKSQTYYVNVLRDPLDNRTYAINIQTHDTIRLFTCQPTNDTSQYFQNVYGDMAMDNNQNLYYVSEWGSLYKRSLTDTSCHFLGSFGHTVNALVADANGDVLAAGNGTGGCTIYKFTAASNSFSTVGKLPTTFFSSGDLFYYENSLFLTSTNATFTSSFLIKIDLSNLSSSCFYMDLPNLRPYGGFTVANPTPRAYLLSYDGTSPSYSTVLYEVNLVSRTLSPALYTFPFGVMGAATDYMPILPLSASCSSSLPVNFTKFNCKLMDKAVELIWETTSETGNQYFLIERSSDGNSFQAIGKKNSAGNGNSIQHYTFVDSAPLLSNFYRLKQVDWNGNYTYSKVVSAKFPSMNSVTILGNPIQDILRIEISANPGDLSDFAILDITGRKLKTGTATSGVQEINLSSVGPGAYRLVVKTKNGHFFSQQFLKVK